MNIAWKISESDIKKVIHFVNENKNLFVENRISRNINKNNIQIDRDTIIKTMLLCLLTSKEDSNPNSNIGVFFRKEPFILTYHFLSNEARIEDILRDILRVNGLTKYFNRIPKHFVFNFSYLEANKWELLSTLEKSIKTDLTKQEERVLADSIDQIFKGFGSKQARNFLQSLGLTKYEIPIDSQMMNWLRDFGYPINLSPVALQDKAFYHFISDGIQLLCEKANIYPCILDAAIFASNNEINREKEKRTFKP